MLTCRRFASLFRPSVWKYVYVDNSVTAGLITRAWIQFPHTRGLTKHLWTRSPDTIDELFASTALSFDLGVTKLAFEGMGTPGARFPKLLAEGIERLSTNLEELTLREYEKVESENFRLSTLVPKLSALDISMPCDDPERFYGLRDLDLLEVAFKIPPDEADDDGTAENTSLGRTAQVVKHCLPTLEYITMFWGGCNCCTSAPMNKRLASLFDAPVGPNLRSFTLDNFQLFSTTRSYPLPDILRALSASPKLRNIYFFSLGRFAPPLDFEEQWKDLRIESVEKLSMASHYSEQTQYRGMLTDNTLRPIVHFLKIFPSLRSLTMLHAFDSTDDNTRPCIEAQLATASPDEFALVAPSLSVLMKVTMKTALVSLRLGKLDIFRRASEVADWEVELVHEIL